MTVGGAGGFHRTTFSYLMGDASFESWKITFIQYVHTIFALFLNIDMITDLIM